MLAVLLLLPLCTLCFHAPSPSIHLKLRCSGHHDLKRDCRLVYQLAPESKAHGRCRGKPCAVCLKADPENNDFSHKREKSVDIDHDVLASMKSNRRSFLRSSVVAGALFFLNPSQSNAFDEKVIVCDEENNWGWDETDRVWVYCGDRKRKKNETAIILPEPSIILPEPSIILPEPSPPPPPQVQKEEKNLLLPVSAFMLLASGAGYAYTQNSGAEAAAKALAAKEAARLKAEQEAREAAEAYSVCGV